MMFLLVAFALCFGAMFCLGSSMDTYRMRAGVGRAGRRTRAPLCALAGGLQCLAVLFCTLARGAAGFLTWLPLMGVSGMVMGVLLASFPGVYGRLLRLFTARAGGSPPDESGPPHDSPGPGSAGPGSAG